MESAAPDPSHDPKHARGVRLASIGIQGVAAAVAFAGALLAANWLLDTPDSVTESVANILLLLAILILVMAGGLAHEVIVWRLPHHKLRRLIEQIRAGEAPIEELSQVNRGATPLREPVKQLLVEIKSLKQQIGELNVEMRQRVAIRTDALERKLGVMKAKASRDALTGLCNRRTLDDELPRLVEAARAERRDLILLMIDVDYFKTLNDTLGHAAGDDLLRSIGQIIRSTIRDSDYAFRYGGDEFVVLLPGADMVSAHALSDRLKHLVDGLTRHHRRLSRRPQLSVGICSLLELPRHAADDEFLAWADQRLYEIKHARTGKTRGAA